MTSFSKIVLSLFIRLNKNVSIATSHFLTKLFGPSNKCEVDYYTYLNQLDISAMTVMELGGTQRPIFNKYQIKKYIGIDIDTDFDWENHYHVYLNQSCTDPFIQKSDLIISKYLLEHVDDNKKTYNNIIQNLNINGSSIHVFPLGFHPYSIITRIIGNKTQKLLIKLLRAETQEITGYPVYYNLCDSISLENHLKKIKGITFEVKYYYGASEYFFAFYPAYLFIEIFNRVFHMLKIKIFASNAVVIIKKITNV